MYIPYRTTSEGTWPPYPTSPVDEYREKALRMALEYARTVPGIGAVSDIVRAAETFEKYLRGRPAPDEYRTGRQQSGDQ